MNLQQQINQYIANQPEGKRNDMQALHTLITALMPGCKLWFLDGTDDKGKVVSNPSIGYGSYTIQYADGKSKAFYQIGLSANTTGLSLYIMGLDDKTYLPATYAATIGKANVTGYCIKFKALKDINIDVLKDAIVYGITTSHAKQ